MHLATRLTSGPLQTERLSDGRRRLLRDLIIEVDGHELFIPVDTVTDFSSIPWYGRTIVRWSRVDVAGVVHDWLYLTAHLPRVDADRIWRLVAIAGDHHANSVQAGICWLALRLGGWWTWNRLRKAEQSSVG